MGVLHTVFNMMINYFSSQKRDLRAVILVPENKLFSHWCVLDCAALPVIVCMCAHTVHGVGDCVHGGELFQGSAL